jgi:uncharacterized membrane protein
MLKGRHMPTHPPASHNFLDLGRLIALIDGVFAVAMTLLVLDLKLPQQNNDLVLALKQMLPGFMIYLIVFASIAGYWIQHHATFHYLARGDSKLVLLSLINLLFVTLYPVSASIVGAHPLEPLATVCLSVNSLFYCISTWGLWSYAAANRQLLAKEKDYRRFKEIALIMLLVAISLALAIPLAFISVYLAYLDWFLGVPIATWWSRGRRRQTT